MPLLQTGQTGQERGNAVNKSIPPSGFQSMLSGGIAGLMVDVSLFPLDTIKTRLQSRQGFIGSGGFKNIYSGLTSTSIGSAPSAALFFLVYEKSKVPLASLTGLEAHSSLLHLISASMGEVTACIVRVPTELIKQRMQAGLHSSLSSVISHVYTHQGFFGFYRGYLMTLFREIPFAAIQFPLYESLKTRVSQWKGQRISTIEAAGCGAIAGGVAAALTTPLDVIKTRIMLSNKTGQALSISSVAQRIWRANGPRGFLFGIGPRVLWISIGGSIFLGTYEAALLLSRGLLF